MSQENISFIFKNLDAGIADLVKTIKAFLKDSQFSNSRNAKECAQPADEDDEIAVFVDDEGIEWAGPDFRNAVLTPYVSQDEDDVDTVTVAVGLVFGNAPLDKAEGVLIVINNDEEYYISGDYPWIDVQERILALIGGEACIAYNDEVQEDVDQTSDETPEANDTNNTRRKRKVHFSPTTRVRKFSDSPEDSPIDCEAPLNEFEKAVDRLRALDKALQQAAKRRRV
jgi:hypothetical protein